MNEKKAIKITIIVIFLLVLFIIVFLVYSINMNKTDISRCSERLNELNISRCDEIGYVPTINPFIHSNKCYCENQDRFYFDIG